MFFHYATRKISLISNISTFFEDLSILNPRSHLKAYHIIGDSSSCIDLTFTTQPDLVMESGIHSSFHSNCHHYVTFAKFNLKINYPLLMNGKSGIIERLMLTKLDKQYASFLGTIVLQISVSMNKCNYLLKPFKI